MNSKLPISSDQLFKILDQEGVAYQLQKHQPIMTVEDSKALRLNDGDDTGQIKNLFVKNKKGKMWLLTLHEDRKVDLKQTAVALGAGRFSFCSEDRLMQYMGITPGAVSPFCMLNDINHEVQFYIDETLMQHPVLLVHPFDNAMTVTLGREDLLQFLKQRGHIINILPQLSPQTITADV